VWLEDKTQKGLLVHDAMMKDKVMLLKAVLKIVSKLYESSIQVQPHH
jgi:hypothetical protein